MPRSRPDSVTHSSSPDGAWLARLLAQPGLSQERQTRAGTRRQTLRMLARCTELTRVERVSDDVSRFLAYGSAATGDAVLAGIPAVARWRGLILRNYSVWAWRELWAWLVNVGINGLTARAELGEKFAGALEPQSVRAFRSQLPATTGPGGHPLPAELDPGLWQEDSPVWGLGLLLLGARRSSELTGAQLDGFHGHDREGRSAWHGARRGPTRRPGRSRSRLGRTCATDSLSGNLTRPAEQLRCGSTSSPESWPARGCWPWRTTRAVSHLLPLTSSSGSGCVSGAAPGYVSPAIHASRSSRATYGGAHRVSRS